MLEKQVINGNKYISEKIRNFILSQNEVTFENA
jgi:hypothetical protein